MAELLSESRFIERARKPQFWPAVSAYMKPDAPDFMIFGATAAAATQSQDFAKSFYELPFPHGEPGVGYASDIPSIGYTVASGLNNTHHRSRLARARREKASYRVLDFGCGSGRLLRFVCEFGENIEATGCDVNPIAIKWLSDNFPCRIHRLKGYSLSFLKGKVDLIYAWSIFTHFSEVEHKKWLKAIAGSLAPGGILFATFKSTDMIARLENDEDYRKKTGTIDLESLKRQAPTGYAFYAGYESERARQHGVDAKTFGQAYISADYIRARWSKFVEIVEFGTAVKDWQDYVVLRKG